VRAAHGAAAAATALAVAFVFYSSFLRHPGGLVQSALAYGVYLERGVGAVAHAQPWYHYLALLAVSKSGGLVWSEGLILLLAAVGIVGAAGKSAGFWPRYLALYALLATIAFSAVRYKTPWNLLPFYSALVVMAGAGTVTLLGWVRPRAPRIALAVVLAAAATQLGVQNWRASVRHGADPRNPYAYVHTSTDFLRLVQRVSDVSRLHPDGASMFVKVLAGPYEQWPLPWYLRRMARVGYWTNATEAADAGDAPVVIASQDVAPQVDAALGDRYVSELYGLRPEVFLTLYVERGSWERLLAARGAAPPAER
jgi:predicted membrane-bound mannosyltransferase